jgi:hypothetical protein
VDCGANNFVCAGPLGFRFENDALVEGGVM